MSGMLRLDSPNASLDADGTVEFAGLNLDQGSYQPVLRSPSPRGIRLVGSVRTEYDGLIWRPITNEVSTSLVFSHAGAGAWVGRRRESSVRPTAVAGVWRQLGSRAILSVSSSIERTELFGLSYRPVFQLDSFYTDTSGWQPYLTRRTSSAQDTVQSRLRWIQTEARVSWARGRLSLDGAASFRSHIDSVRRSSVTASGYATVAMRPSVAFSVGVGAMNTGYQHLGSTTRFFSASVKLAPAALLRPRQAPEIVAFPTAFSIGELGDGEYEVRVRLPRARTVELAGDFNDWKPVRLSQTEAETWHATLRLRPGTYHMNIRVDGATWIAPPGIPTVSDEFNGQVGLVIIR
jgi:hypothetical protein